MNILYVLIGLVLWLYIGYKGFIYWWTTDLDFKLKHVYIAVSESMLGPFSWIAGWLIHAEIKSDTILIPKKEKKI